jgi:hypothetical protein
MKLFALKKQLFNEIVEHVVIHVQQSRMKRQVFSHAIIAFFGATNPFKKLMNNNNNF